MLKFDESGRSMVEMLGVLAIIGVLSIGGIAGYTYAMNKSKANDILDGVSQRALVVSQQMILGNTASLVEYNNKKIGDYEVNLSDKDYGTGFFGIQVSGVEQAVCERLQDQGLVNAVKIELEGTVLADATCTDGNGNVLTYVFNDSLNANATVGDNTGEDDEENDPCNQCTPDYDDWGDPLGCRNSDGQICDGCFSGLSDDDPCRSEERCVIIYDDDPYVFCFVEGEEDLYCRGFGGDGDGYVWRDGECVLDCSVCSAGENDSMGYEPCGHSGDPDAPCMECIPHEGSDYCIAEEDCQYIHDGTCYDGHEDKFCQTQYGPSYFWYEENSECLLGTGITSDCSLCQFKFNGTTEHRCFNSEGYYCANCVGDATRPISGNDDVMYACKEKSSCTYLSGSWDVCWDGGDMDEYCSDSEYGNKWDDEKKECYWEDEEEEY